MHADELAIQFVATADYRAYSCSFVSHTFVATSIVFFVPLHPSPVVAVRIRHRRDRDSGPTSRIGEGQAIQPPGSADPERLAGTADGQVQEQATPVEVHCRPPRQSEPDQDRESQSEPA
jgi:hypothetical protein